MYVVTSIVIIIYLVLILIVLVGGDVTRGEINAPKSEVFWLSVCSSWREKKDTYILLAVHDIGVATSRGRAGNREQEYVFDL